MAYEGSVELISGITQKGGGSFPLVHAASVQVGADPAYRLDEALDDLVEQVETATEQETAQYLGITII